jgi:Mrp family chromosome partitioning ATPase
MVVGRQALKQLAQIAAVPPPHAAFSQSRLAAASQVATPQSPASASMQESHRPAAEPRTVQESRVSVREPMAASEEKPQQLRVDSARSAGGEASFAALEVDRLAWPPTCDALIESAAADFEPVTLQLTDQAANCGVAAVLSIEEGHGGTTIAMCLARILAQTGKRVCLVDGNYRQPGLADCLGLETEGGLECVLAGDAKLSDILVESLEDHLMLLPLSRPLAADALERSKLRQTVTFGELRDQFDVVIVDAGSVGATPPRRPGMPCAGLMDSIILVGRESADAAVWQRARQALAEWNVPCLGAIANRCAA